MRGKLLSALFLFSILVAPAAHAGTVLFPESGAAIAGWPLYAFFYDRASCIEVDERFWCETWPDGRVEVEDLTMVVGGGGGSEVSRVGLAVSHDPSNGYWDSFASTTLNMNTKIFWTPQGGSGRVALYDINETVDSTSTDLGTARYDMGALLPLRLGVYTIEVDIYEAGGAGDLYVDNVRSLDLTVYEDGYAVKQAGDMADAFGTDIAAAGWILGTLMTVLLAFGLSTIMGAPGAIFGVVLGVGATSAIGWTPIWLPILGVGSLVAILFLRLRGSSAA